MKPTFRQVWYSPTFSSLLSNRREGLFIAGAGAVHLGLTLAGLPTWFCPIRAVTGIPCPGCGLTRAVLQFMHGDFLTSLQTHAFAPIFLLALVMMLIGLVIPEKYRQRLLGTLRNWEVQTGFTSWMLFGLMIYWVIRLMGWIPFPNLF